ncbi:hypothetical protein H0H93_010925 [Arthromyces matolae]|nr:hypothetical protein H0H93_010925 [Arthromyces matolae]
MPRPRQPRHPRGKANNIKPEGRAQQPHVEAQEEEIDPEPESMEKQKSKFRPASSSAASTSSTNPRRAESSRTVRHKIKPVRKEEEEEEEEEGIAHAKIEVASPSHLPPPPDQEIEEDENFWRFGTKSPDTQGHALTRMEAATEIGQSNASTPLRRDLLEVKEEPNVEDERRARVSSASTNLTLPDNSQRIPLASTRPARIANNNPELRFRVVVYGPYNDQVSEFRMRGGHPVQKVLEAVCRTFEVPFELSYLILLEEENGEDQMYLCSLDETIGDCGITSTSILIVQAPGWQREERLDRREEEEEEEE